MLWTVLYGGIVLAFAPLAIALVAYLGPNPALAVIAMACAFFTLMAPLQLTGIAYVIVVAASGEAGDDLSVFNSATAQRAEAGKVWFVVFGVAFHCIARILFAWALVVADRFFRTHHQVLYASAFRILPIGIASGVGAALVGSVLPFGALAQAASQLDDPWIAVAPLGVDTVFINWDVCPYLPFVAYAAMSTALTTVSAVCFYGITIVGVAAMLGEPETLPPPLPPPPLPNTPTAAAHADDAASEANPLPDAETAAVAAGVAEDVDTAAVEAVVGEEEKDEGPPSSPIPPEAKRTIPAPTSLSRAAGVAAVLGVVVLHLVASLVTLINDGAFDWQTASTVAGRGCSVSLPTQAAVMLVSMATIVAIAVRDVAPLPQVEEPVDGGDEPDGDVPPPPSSSQEERGGNTDAGIGAAADSSLQPAAASA